MEAPGVLSYHYPLYLCRFYACCLEFFVLSIIYINAPEGCQHGTHYHCSPKEHPGLGAASARRHRAFLCACGRDGRGERRRLRRVELGAGLSSKAAKAAAHLSRQRMKPSPILSQGPKQTWTSLTMRSRRLRSTTSSSTRFWPCRGLRAMCEHGGGVAGVLNNGFMTPRRVLSLYPFPHTFMHFLCSFYTRVFAFYFIKKYLCVLVIVEKGREAGTMRLIIELLGSLLSL